MNDCQILNYQNISFDKLEFTEPYKTKYGSHITSVHYRIKRNNLIPIYVETPKLKTINYKKK